MASGNLTAQTEVTAPDGSNLLYVVTGGTTDGKIYLGGLNVQPDGTLVNGKISVTVATNNITVALKTKSGGNPSATDPVSIWINGTLRRCTAPLSVTKNAGTNWFNAGAAEFATLEQDYFVYIIWNTTPATDIVDIGFARIPYGRIYSDFSGTTTSEKYLASSTTPTSTDDLCVVGRFAATLSATAAFNWSVPTYTSINKIDVPIYETRLLTYAPTLTGYSVAPTATVYRYQIKNNTMKVHMTQGTNGTSNATTISATAPMAAVTITNAFWAVTGYAAVDNATVQTAPPVAVIASASSTINIFKNSDGGTTAWTNVLGKRVGYIGLEYPLA